MRPYKAPIRCLSDGIVFCPIAQDPGLYIDRIYIQDIISSWKTLENDGLERGYISFEFILHEMWLLKEYKKQCDVKKMGELLQIIDDILDIEEDTADNQLNCLRTDPERWLSYFLEDATRQKLESTFPRRFALLKLAIHKAQKKAATLLRS